MAQSPPQKPPSGAPSIGILAVQFGIITQKQLMACLDFQRGDGAEMTLEEILLERGLITREAIEKLRQGALAASPQPSKTAAGAGGERKGTSEKGKGRGTTAGRKRSTTSIRLKAQGAAPARPPRASAADEPEDAPSRNNALLVGMLMAFVPLLVLGGYGIWRALAGPASRPPDPAGTSHTDGPPPVTDPGRTPVKPEDREPAETITVRLEPLPGSDEVAAQWNRIADRIAACRSPEQYKPYLSELLTLLGKARGGPHERPVKEGYVAVRGAMKRRAEQVFDFLKDDSERLQKAGKFGDAVKGWDWFPGNLDTEGDFAGRIERHIVEAMQRGRSHFAMLRDRAQKLEQEKKYDQAKAVMLEAFEVGLADLSEEAWKHLNRLEDLDERAKREASAKEIEESAQRVRSERESGQKAAVVRGQFWDLVTARKFQTAEAFLKSQREGQPEPVQREIAVLDRVFADVKLVFSAAEAHLAKRSGQKVALAFVENGQTVVKELQLKGVANGVVSYVHEGRDFTASAYDLAPSELERVAAAVEPRERGSLVRGVAALLRDDFAAALTFLADARAEGAALVAFVEGSTVFLQKNAALYRDRAARHVQAEEWDRAAQEFTKLALLPAERRVALRGRARAYYQLGNFVGTVLDVEQLFELGDFDDDVIKLLNDSFQRATLMERAIKIYESARLKVPENGDIVVGLASLYINIHEYEKAARALAEADRIKGGQRALVQYYRELLKRVSAPAFKGPTFKARWGRYEVESSVSEAFSKEMARFLGDTVYPAYVRFFPYKKNDTLRFYVKLFATEAEFFDYYRMVNQKEPESGGSKVGAYYFGLTKELVGWNSPGVREDMQHEGLHQFVDFFVDQCPMWFNEGYASFFEKSTVDEARFNKSRHQAAAGLLGSKRLPSLQELLMMDRRTFDKDGHLHYGSSWSFIYLLHKRGQRVLLDRYFEELMAGRTQRQAFDAVFGKVNLDSLETQWKRAILDQAYEP